MYNFAPAILPVTVAFAFAPTDNTISLVVDGISYTYTLTGIVYYADHHFTARFIDSKRNVWFNDGMVQGRHAMMEGTSDIIAFETDRYNRKPDTYIYTRHDTAHIGPHE
ncbi:hypothetical protein EDD18DRAFT_1106139 [Armillaria luteobubalina]|uniref:Uncharacterized protein n=1 Tax=Armillaria luteobubalina TaxID=153913 RepID=A0AA39TN42_9AGAR|nr:hypothetical protein EDD18DRAFT_1106139 [Armillaria luteobubalina]